MKHNLLLFLAFVMLSCIPDSDDPDRKGQVFDKTGYRPVYRSEAEVSNIQVLGETPLSDPGKIYIYGTYLFVNEKGKGVHIIDNSDPKNPDNLSFISIPSNFDIAVKENWLYADNATDLLVFDISKPEAPKLTKRIDDAIAALSFPLYTNVYFECADPRKGVVVDWEKVNMDTRPNCFR
jgi:hypothetical protein